MFRPTLLLLALLPAAAAGQSLSAEQVKTLSAATVYLKVKAPGVTGTGSGFVARVEGETVYVVTNQHVADPRTKGGGDDGKAAVEVVFESGQGPGKERTFKGTVVAADPVQDLAVVKLTGVKNPPAPLDLTAPPELVLTAPVFACGFPLGGKLAAGEKNPEITITPCTVSALRKNPLGQEAVVQLAGQLNPGNSGGPVVTPDGKLAGVAVRAVLGASIGEAVPRNEVVTLLRGRVGAARLVPAGEGKARLEVPVLDPLGTVKAVLAHHRPAGAEPPPLANGRMTGAARLPLTVADGVATGEVKLPDGENPAVFVQVEATLTDGGYLTAPEALSPITPRLKGGSGGDWPMFRLPDGQVLPAPPPRLPPGDAEDTLTELIRDPAALVGKPVEFDAFTLAAVTVLGADHVLTVETGANKEPPGLVVVVPKDLAAQLHALGLYRLVGELRFAVRVKGTVKKPGPKDDRYRVEASGVDFLDGSGGVAAAFPAPPADGKPTLSALDQDPAKFVGKDVTVQGVVRGVKQAGAGFQLDVTNANGANPLNLDFYTSQDLHKVLEAEVPGGGARAKLSLTVKSLDKAGRGVVGVSKVELTGPGGKSFDSRKEIAYPKAPPPPKPPVSPKPEEAKPKADAAAVKADAGGGNGFLIAVVGGGVLAGVAGAAAAFVFLRKRGGDSGAEEEVPPAKPKYAAKKPAAPPPPRAAKPKPPPPTPGGGGSEFPGFDFEK